MLGCLGAWVLGMLEKEPSLPSSLFMRITKQVSAITVPPVENYLAFTKHRIGF